ncbi:MAG: PEP-utilizing enzyme [Vicinamibacterales bacterium]
MAAFAFSTKAGTLADLSGRITTARIAPLVSCQVRTWKQAPGPVVAAITESLGSGPFIVRSSCRAEDTSTGSNAGAFLSVLDVPMEAVSAAIDQVIASYDRASDDDEVLVQPMLAGVTRSGVAFSHDPNTGGPYRVVSWTDGVDTAAVTSGRGGRSWQAAALSTVPPPEGLEGVVPLLEELLHISGGQPVDCEFACTRGEIGEPDVLWLLQVRPLIMTAIRDTPETQATRLQTIAAKVERGIRPHPFLMGRRTVYGVMPDWNPAEIVGVRPRPLALSLYRELITDAIWAYQRNNYGYRNLRSFPLMPHFCGLPYIDVRLSFNSFVPADLDEGLASRLVDHYIERLLAEPKLHDKVEFEIVYSCYTIDLPERLERLRAAGFSAADCTALADSLRRLTNRIVHPSDGLWCDDAAKLDTLKTRREALFASGADPLERVYWLLEDAKRYGTLPFAGLARAGFVAVQILKSLVAVGVFSEADYDAFMAGLSTISGQLARDRAMLDQSTFLARYGHLRPGTYDILSPRYDEAPDLYFDWTQRPEAPEPLRPFSMTLPQLREIGKLLSAHGLTADVVSLFTFLQSAIELREFSKFQFTRNLSDALSLMTAYGASLGFTVEDLAFCDVAAFQELHVAALDPRRVLEESVARGRARYEETLAVALPPLIAHPDDVWAFEWPESSPNFITQNAVTAAVWDGRNHGTLAGAVVCIPSADPGFDWLFAYPIAGLITAWGGANSHMAIRAGELAVPAVIGSGEVLYRRWSTAQRLHIDCASRRVDILA